MPQKTQRSPRRGHALKGPILMLAGLSDIIIAGGLWYWLELGEMPMLLVPAFMALSGLGLISVGLLTTLRNV